MATININFDVKSIKNAIKQLNQVQKKMHNEVPGLFIRKCLEWVKVRANYYLSNIPMDSEVTSNIQSSWEIEDVSDNVKRLINTSDKSVYVEFGVGVIGQNNAHPQASEEKYEYNVQTRYKHSDGRWVFSATHKQYAIDLNEGYFSIYERQNSGKVVAITKGSPANMYLYNSAMDLLSEGAYKKLWEEALKETI